MFRNHNPTSALSVRIGPRASTSMRVGNVSEVTHSSARRPPYMITPSTVPLDPSAPEPAYAIVKSPMAPARSVGSAAASFRLSGGTISGSETRSGSLHPVSGSTMIAAHRVSRRNRSPFSSRVVMAVSSGSEGDVDPGEEIPHRRLSQEISRVEVRLACVVQLGIYASVLRPSREVPAGQREGQRAGPEPRRPSAGREVGQRQLA